MRILSIGPHQVRSCDERSKKQGRKRLESKDREDLETRLRNLEKVFAFETLKKCGIRVQWNLKNYSPLLILWATLMVTKPLSKEIPVLSGVSVIVLGL